jgi:hypothetical protein
LALVEGKVNFDKNPRLEAVVGFFMHPRLPAGRNRKTKYEQND